MSRRFWQNEAKLSSLFKEGTIAKCPIAAKYQGLEAKARTIAQDDPLTHSFASAAERVII